MSLGLGYIPRLPFDGFKWKWASLQCTEGINDPVVLLGVLYRMRKLEKQNRALTYSSEEFAAELNGLAADIADRGIGVDLARRTGERNLIRNSGQYWRALGLMPDGGRGVIQLTPFGRRVELSQRARLSYGAAIPPSIVIPSYVNVENLRWRCDNYRGF